VARKIATKRRRALLVPLLGLLLATTVVGATVLAFAATLVGLPAHL
jgi:hypothetical protein